MSKLGKKQKKLFDIEKWPSILVQDMIEHDRLVAQHYILRQAFGSDYHAPIHSLLNSTSDLQKKNRSSLESLHQQQQQKNNSIQEDVVVLDIGCGLGQWTMEMSTLYPNTTFIGIDILANFPKDIKPKNCHFRQMDIRQLPLPFPDNSVDFIYQRDLNWALSQHDWHPLMLEYMRILKPGGWIELVEQDLETKSSLEKECAMNDLILHGFTLRNQDPFAARQLPSILAIHGFRRVSSHFQSLPLGWRHQEDEDEEEDHLNNGYTSNYVTLGQAVASQYIFFLRSIGPWLRLVMGLSPAKYIKYVEQLPLEWEVAKTYVNWHCATAQKPF
ncbi:S-adenosyl-L-methionine-dependent methyltransferase [Cunninghamella echinulata]|nr:S-adenosyl-L-methionine-dependent methyltransferase [Cunninghamella echinulata]